MNRARGGKHIENVARPKKKPNSIIGRSGRVFLAFALALLLWPASNLAFAEHEEADEETFEQVGDVPSSDSDEGGSSGEADENGQGADDDSDGGAGEADEPSQQQAEGQEQQDDSDQVEGDEASATEQEAASQEGQASDEDAVEGEEAKQESDGQGDDSGENEKPQSEKAQANNDTDKSSGEADVKRVAAKKNVKTTEAVGQATVTVDYSCENYNTGAVTATVNVNGVDEDADVAVKAESGADVEGPDAGESRTFTVTYDVAAGEEKEFTGEITVNVGEDQKEFTQSFVIDKHAPVYKDGSFEVDGGKLVEDGTTKYYALSDSEALTFTVKVDEKYLDTAKSQIKVEGLSATIADTEWTKDGDVYTGKRTVGAGKFVKDGTLETAKVSLYLVDKAENTPDSQVDPDGEDVGYTSESALVTSDAMAVDLEPAEGVHEADIDGKRVFDGPVSLVVKAKESAGFTLGDGSSINGFTGAVSDGTYSATVDEDGEYAADSMTVKTVHGTTAEVKLSGTEFVVASQKPVLTATLDTSKATNGEAPYLYKQASDVAVTLKVTNPLSIKDYTLKVNGEDITDFAVLGNGTWEVVLDGSIPLDDLAGSTTYRIEFSATSVFDSVAIDDAHSAVFKVDTVGPEITFDFQDLKKGVSEGDKVRPVFGIDGYVAVKISDPNLGDDPVIKLTKNGEEVNGISWTSSEGLVSSEIAYVPVLASENTEGDWSITVEAADALGNEGTKTYPDAATVKDGDEPLKDLADKFTIDTKPVEIKSGGFVFGEEPVVTSAGLAVYKTNGSVSGTLTVIDRDLDTNASKVNIYKAKLDGVSDYGSAQALAWPEPGFSNDYVINQDFEAGYKYKVEINANDYAGNGSNPASPITQEFAVYGDKPTIAIEIDAQKTATEKGVDYYGEKPKSGNGYITATVSVTTPFWKEAEAVTNGEASAWESDESGYTHTSTVTFAENKAGDEPYTLEVNAQDELGYTASDEIATPFKVDFSDPVVIVTYSPDGAAGTLDGVDYYAADTTATIEISDATLRPDVADTIKSSLEDDGATVDVTAPFDATTGSCTLKAAYEQGGPAVTYSMAFDASDLATHKTSYKYASDKNPEANKGFAVDTEAPKLSVTFKVDSVGANGDTDYYDAKKVKVAVKAEDCYLDADNLKVKAHGGEVDDWEGTPETGMYTTTVTYVENEAGADPYDLEVFVQDKLYTASGDSSEYAIHKQSWAYDENNATASKNFVVDGTAPAVKVEMDQPVVANRGGTDYYGNADGDVLTATITVTDNNFDKKNSPINPTDLGNVVQDWKQGSDKSTWTAKVAFKENTSPEASDLKATLVDMVQTYGKNLKNEHKTAYDYGTEDTKADGTATSGKNFLLDLTAPDLTSAIETVKYSNRANGRQWLFYNNEAAGLNLTLTDAIGIKQAKAESPYTLTGSLTNIGTNASKKLALIEGSSVGERDSLIKIMHDDALVTLTDYVGNWGMWNISPNGKVYLVKQGRAGKSTNSKVGLKDGTSNHPDAMVKDTKAPVVAWTSAPKAGGYFNTTQKATLSITEMNFDLLQRFDGDCTIYIWHKEEGKAGRSASEEARPASKASGVGDAWTMTETFAEDGHYRLEAQFKDYAGNMSNKAVVEEFTIDKTAPKITITWDNNDVRNGKYYKAGRTATVVVEEHNFDPALVKFDTNGAVGGWSDSGDTHTCHVAFTTDGDYHLSMSMTDKAGNAADKKEEDFTVDLTAPTIRFENVEDKHAYNDNVIAPTVVYEDEKNFDANGMEHALVGSKHGERSDFKYGESVDGNTGTHSYDNLPDEVESDDIYTIDAHLVDLAGNEAEGSITFSVNRYGSNFIVLEEEKYEDGILNAAPEVVVQEINVDGSDAKHQSVSVSHGLSTEDLERLADGNADMEGFYVKSSSDASGWVQNEWHVGRGNFAQHDENDELVRDEANEIQFDDGNYHVVVNNTDLATNLNNSAQYYNPETHKADTAEVEFTLDTHKPIVDGLNVSDGGFYASGNKELTFTVTDNVGVRSVEVEIDGQAASPEAAEGGLYSVTVPEGFVLSQRNVVVRAYDLANNMGEGRAENFHVFGVWQIVLALAAVAGVGGGGAYARRRKKVR